MNSIDYKELAIHRLATEFKESTNLINYIRSMLSEANLLELALIKTLNKRSIDSATGKQLDIIGEIVGQSREFIDAEIFNYFGFSPNFQAKSFGTISNINIGGRFRFVNETTTGVRLLNDEEYRTFIRARIIRNISKSTPEEVIAQLKFVFGANQVVLTEDQASYTISIGKMLSLNEKSILTQTDIIPKTAGVKVNYLTEYNGNSFFAFKNFPNSKGFGSLTHTSIGGQLGQLI